MEYSFPQGFIPHVESRLRAGPISRRMLTSFRLLYRYLKVSMTIEAT